MNGDFPLTEPKPVILNSYCLGWDSSQKRVSWSNYVKSCCWEWMCETSTILRFQVFLYFSEVILQWKGVMLLFPVGKDKKELSSLSSHFLSCLSKKLLGHWVNGGWRNEENIHWVRAFDADYGMMLYKYNEHAPFLSIETKQHCRFLCQLFGLPDNVKDVGKDKTEFDRWSPHFMSCL